MTRVAAARGEAMEERREGGDGLAISGAGGKMTRRSFRTRSSSTPYDRPPLARKVDSGWFSKLLLQPASKILPSIFSGRSQDHNLPPLSQPESLSEPEREDCDAEAAEPTLISDEQGAPAKTGQPEADSKGNELVGDNSGNIWDGNGLADIVQQLRQKNFSIDETNRLIELLRSRTIDLPEDDGHTARFTPEAPETISGRKNFRTTKEEYPVYKISKTSDPSPFRAQDVGSSPIEIAKAYMGDQTLPLGYDCQSGRLKRESVFSSEKSILKLPSTPAAKSSICRPGAVVQSEHGYFTPQRGRTGFGPRTPYTGTIFSNSKFQVNGERAESSSAARKQSLAPMFGSTKKSSRRANPNLDNSFSSGGPIRHVRPMNMMTTSTEASPSSRSTSFPFLSKSSNASIAGGNPKPTTSKRGFYNVQSIDVDDGASEFPSDCLTVHPQSSKMAKKILEHLNRTIPSPKEKSSELKLATERTRSPNSSALLKDGHDDRSRTVISNYAEQKTSCLLGRDVVCQEGANAKKVLLGPSTIISNDKDGSPSPLQTNNPAIFRRFQKAAYTEASHSSHETPVAASKPDSKRSSRDNGINFTFPVSFTTDALDESPPTPTMTSSVAARKKFEATREDIPSFNFGSSTSDSRIVFSLSSPSNPPDTITTIPVFKFGTENKPALSFKPIGKDAFCC